MNPLIRQTTPSVPGSPEARTRKLDLLLLISLGGSVLSVAYYYYRGIYLCLGYPHNTFLFDPKWRFVDYYDMVRLCHDLGLASKYSLYLPFANYYFYQYGLLSRPFGVLYFYLLPTLCLLWLGEKTMEGICTVRKATYLLGVFMISYPFLFALDRGNLELHVFALSAVFAMLYQRMGRRTKVLAAACLAIPVAFKAYPVLFAGLYLKDRRFKELALLVALVTALTFMGIAASGKSLSDVRHGFSQNVGSAADVPLAVGARYNLGLCNAVRMVLTSLHATTCLQIFERLYLPAAILLLAVIGALVIIRPLELWQSTTALACSMCLIPKVSYDYKLLLVIVPLCLFVRASTAWSRVNLVICCLFGLLLVPKGQVILAYDPVTSWGPAAVSVASLLNPLLLSLLLVLVLLPQSSPPESFKQAPP